MGVVIAYIAICVVPVSVCVAVRRLVNWWPNRPVRGGRAPEVNRDEELDKLRQRLRRLSHEHKELLASDVAAKVKRLRAIELAYDDTLQEACRAFDVDQPPSPIPAAARAQAEAELMVRGFVW
jgi:hypothetical protein